MQQKRPKRTLLYQRGDVFVKKFLLILIALMLALLCACHEDEHFVGPMPLPEEQTEEPAGPAVFMIDGTEYELSVPAKTRITDNGEGYVEIATSSLTEPGAVIDLSGLSGCEYIKDLTVDFNGEDEKLIIPKLQNLLHCQFSGNAPALIDASAAEGCTRLSFEAVPAEVKIGKGPENLELGYGFDISKISGASNVKSVVVHGDADLSKIADIGEVENVYIFGENDNVAGLEGLKSLKKLSFQAFAGDLSGIGKLSMESLVFNSDVKMETLDTLSASETVTELWLNDEFITNSDFMDKLPSLEELYLTVDPIQPPEVPVWDEITDVSQIDLLETGIPKEKLKAFFENGGKIYIMDDWSRT